MPSVTGLRDGSVVVGDGVLSDGVVSTSSDGETWERFDDARVFGDSAEFGHLVRSCVYEPGVIACYQQMMSAATDGERIVAVGYDTGYIETLGAVWIWQPVAG
jgi:hypothetical protein